MKFIVSSSTLLKQLQLINGVINSNTVLPILEDFLFDINESKLTITASDLETVMSVDAHVDSSEIIRVCIPAKILIDTLKNIPDQPLTFKIDDKFGVKIISSSGEYKMMGESAEHFPKQPQSDNTTAFKMKSSALVTAINKTIFAVSNDDLRPAMTGVFFELSKDSVQFVSTDAHKLVRYKRTDTFASKDGSFIVPKKPLNLLRNALPDNDDELEISYNQNHLFINHEKIQMICRLVDATFPNYRVIIPSNNPFTLKINKVDFQHALRRVSIFSNKSTSQVALNITSSMLNLMAQDVDFSFEGDERMNCEYEGDDLKIAFNSKFLIEMLGAIETNDAVMELSAPNKAGIIKPSEPSEGEDLIMLVMPLMLND